MHSPSACGSPVVTRALIANANLQGCTIKVIWPKMELAHSLYMLIDQKRKHAPGIRHLLNDPLASSCKSTKDKCSKNLQLSFLPFSTSRPRKQQQCKNVHLCKFKVFLQLSYFVDMGMIRPLNPAFLRVVVYSVFLSFASFAGQVSFFSLKETCILPDATELLKQRQISLIKKHLIITLCPNMFWLWHSSSDSL